MLYSFDLDDTLIAGYMARPDKDYAPVELLPNRRETIAALIAEGHQIAIVTNQAGVAFGHINQEDARTKLQVVGASLGFGTIEIHAWRGQDDRYMYWGTGNETPITKRALPIFVCYCDARSKDESYNQPVDCARRKPSGAMIEEAISNAMIEYFNSETEEFEDVPALFVGDRPEDEAAAKDAGVSFQWAKDFFNA